MSTEEQKFDLATATVDDTLNEFMKHLIEAMPKGFMMPALNQALVGVLLKKGIITFEEITDAVAEIDAVLKAEVKKQQQQQNSIIVPGVQPGFDPDLLKKIQGEGGK